MGPNMWNTACHYWSHLPEEAAMKKILTCVMSALLMGLPVLLTATSAGADDKEKEKDEDRLKNCGTVLKEILDIPDDVPKDLLDKADCVVVFPSVLKAAFVIGGSYGRGAMTCRRGEDFSGRWGAPTMMALEVGRFPLRKSPSRELAQFQLRPSN